jgi:hypothetical protein
MIFDCDSFYLDNVVDMFRNCETNMVTYRTDPHEKPIYSYLELENNNVIQIAEKIKISNNINNGCYCFIDINTLYNYSYKIINNVIDSEPYMSCIVSEMLKDNEKFSGYELSNFYSLGTLEEINKYKDNTTIFLFDLDGTLVNSDEVYFNVWKTILEKYNMVLTKDIYYKYILGNNDLYVKTSLMLNDNITYISELID